MRISDWSSDVCSSDLPTLRPMDIGAHDDGARAARHLVSGISVEDSHGGLTLRASAGFTGNRPETRKSAQSSPSPSPVRRSEEHTSELQSLMRISYAVFCLKKKTKYKKRAQQ